MGSDALAVAGCIPIVPGSFAAHGMFALYALTNNNPADPLSTVVTAIESLLRVVFAIAAIGTGLSIAKLILRNRL